MSEEATPQGGQQAPAPLFFLNGQPISAEAAAATCASLLGNETYAKEALTDPEKQRHLALLWQLERGIQPPPPETIEQAEQQIGDKLERDCLMHASALHSSAEFTPEQVHQIVNGRPIPPQEQIIARQRLEVLKKDKGFVERYFNLRNEKIIAAVNEELDKRFRIDAIIGWRVLVEVAQEPDHRHRLQAAIALLDRGGFHATHEQRIKVEHVDMSGEAMVERIRQLAQRLDMDPQQLLGSSVPPMKVVN